MGEFVEKVRVTVVILASLTLCGFIHYQDPHVNGLWMVYTTILGGTSFMLVGRAFGTGDIAKIVAAKNGK